MYEIESGKLSMVTNVKTGAFMPEVTPDGRTLFYIGYTADGFDLFSMPLDAARYLKAPPPPARDRSRIPIHHAATTPSKSTIRSPRFARAPMSSSSAPAPSATP